MITYILSLSTLKPTQPHFFLSPLPNPSHLSPSSYITLPQSALPHPLTPSLPSIILHSLFIFYTSGLQIFYHSCNQMKNTSVLSSSSNKLKHPLQSNSQVTICKLTESIVNQGETDIDAIIQNKYNTQERKLIIVDRSKGKIIDSRLVDIQQQIKNSMQQSFFVPSFRRSIDNEQYVYQKISEQNQSFISKQNKQVRSGFKSIWDDDWKQLDRLHQNFLQSIIKNQPLQFINFLEKKASQLPIDINYRFQSNWAPIHYAAMHSSIQIISRLINDPRIALNTLTDFGETPLHIAAKSNKMENCLLLISAGVPIDNQDHDQSTALHYATELGYREIVESLLNNGASCTIKNSTGMRAMDLASAQLSTLFLKYKQAEQQNAMYRNRSNHRSMIEKMLQHKNVQEIVPKEEKSERKEKKDAQFWRKKHIFKFYQFVRETQKIETITLSSFKFYKKIGEGAFGEVYLVKKGTQPPFYALKAIRKERVFGTNLYRYIQTEKDILSLLNHPFIVRLRYAFQTQTYLFLVMDYCQGGDLSRLLEKRKRFNEKQVKHYAAEILLGLQALHKHGIIYRDLKPENIVLDSQGHALITDFGLSKKTDNLDAINKSFCGTPAYLPLEIINKKGHTRMADWYEYGIVLYQLYTGYPPFFAQTKNELYELVRKGMIRFAKNTPDLFKDIIKKLLAQNTEKRLGFEKDAESVREHPWFADIDWQQVIERKLEMPVIENKLKIGEPIKTKFHDVKSEKFQIPMWSFMQ